MPTPFSTASSTTLNGSTCQATACGEPEQNQSSRVDRTNRSVPQTFSQRGSAPWATSRRNTGRHQIGMPGRLHRNRQAGDRCGSCEALGAPELARNSWPKQEVLSDNNHTSAPARSGLQVRGAPVVRCRSTPARCADHRRLRRDLCNPLCLPRTKSGCLYRELHPAVMMMKSAEDRLSGDLADPLDLPMARRILIQGQMRSEFIVIAGVGGKDSTQMGVAQNDDVLE